jgi:hypothetical protein
MHKRIMILSLQHLNIELDWYYDSIVFLKFLKFKINIFKIILIW